MADEYIAITRQNGETYEFRLTDALLSFLQRMAEDEAAEQEIARSEHNRMEKNDACTRAIDFSDECHTKGWANASTRQAPGLQ